MSEPMQTWLDLNSLPPGSKMIAIRNLRGPWRLLNDDEEDDEDSEDLDEEDDEEVPDMLPDELPEELPGGDRERRGMFF